MTRRPLALLLASLVPAAGFAAPVAPSDRDGDGLSDAHEVHKYGTDPESADSDGDGWDDGEEVEAGTNPNDPLDFPNAPQAVPELGDGGIVVLCVFMVMLGYWQARRESEPDRASA